MMQEEFKKYTDNDLHNLADDISDNITIRSYINGNSKDIKRPSTKPEKEIISNIAFAALWAYRWRSNGNVDSILDTAEMALDMFIPEVNGYDTLYIPLKRKMRLLPELDENEKI